MSNFEANVHEEIMKRGFQTPKHDLCGPRKLLRWCSWDPSCRHYLVTRPAPCGAVEIGVRPSDDTKAAGINQDFYAIGNTEELEQFMQLFHCLGQHCPACMRRTRRSTQV